MNNQLKQLLAVAIVATAVTTTSYGVSLLLNDSFESPAAPGPNPPESTPDNWTFFSSGGQDSSGVKSTVHARTGGQVLQFFAPDTGAESINAYQGYFQSASVNLGVSNTTLYSAYMRLDPGLPLQTNNYAKLGIEFRYLGAEVQRVELQIEPWQMSTGEWRQFSISGVNTSLVDELRFTIIEFAGANPPPGVGIFWVDDAYAEVVPEPSVFALVLGGATVLHFWRRRRA